MTTELTTRAIEKSTYIITAAFTDENDLSVIPTAITWTLSDLLGNIINTREDIDYEVDNGVGSPGTLASSIDIVLTGDSLEISNDRDTETRRLVIEATYNSSLGTGLNLRDSAEFEVQNLVAVI